MRMVNQKQNITRRRPGKYNVAMDLPPGVKLLRIEGTYRHDRTDCVVTGREDARVAVAR